VLHFILECAENYSNLYLIYDREAMVHPRLKPFLDQVNALDPTVLNAMTLEQGRYAYLCFALMHAGWPRPIRCIEDLLVDSQQGSHKIPVRVYRPEVETPLPCILYIHGGGWQRGDLTTHDSICRHMAALGECMVISVQWRLAPEHPFPAGFQDVMDVYSWMSDDAEALGIDRRRVGIAGDSAGGNLTPVLTQ